MWTLLGLFLFKVMCIVMLFISKVTEIKFFEWKKNTWRCRKHRLLEYPFKLYMLDVASNFALKSYLHRYHLSFFYLGLHNSIFEIIFVSVTQFTFNSFSWSERHFDAVKHSRLNVRPLHYNIWMSELLNIIYLSWKKQYLQIELSFMRKDHTLGFFWSKLSNLV